MPGIDKEETEWSYRLRDPGQFSKFRRKEMGKGVSFVYGQLKNSAKWKIQSLRFSFKQFPTRASVRKWLDAHPTIGESFSDFLKDVMG